ncbi:unnamed protein product [Effrenium voratum]|uniref:Uncharacterized protein n=1 Tax=Effrenium voratum TaxID=2562239 RepID=A0AA36MUS0_9DINO|nr:unnamed protein product [Effrenium voratum]
MRAWSRPLRCLQVLRRPATFWAQHNLRPPRVGETWESFLPPCALKPACITWHLHRQEIMDSNALYPLESLWVHQGKLRCRLVAYVQGGCFHLRLSPSCEAGSVVQEMELQAMLNLFGLTEQPLSTFITEDNFHHKGVAVELEDLTGLLRAELRLRKFAAVLRSDMAHLDAAGGHESSRLDLVLAPPQPFKIEGTQTLIGK